MPHKLLYAIHNRLLRKLIWALWVLVPAVWLLGCFEEEQPLDVPYIVEVNVIGPSFVTNISATSSDVNIELPFDVDTIQIELKTNEQSRKHASVFLNDQEVSGNKLPLRVGVNRLRVEEVNQQGATLKVFTIYLQRFNSAFLSGLSVTDGVSILAEPHQPFNKYSQRFIFSFPREVDRCYLQFQKDDSLSLVNFLSEQTLMDESDGYPLEIGSNLFKIEVLSADGREKRNYEIDVVREPIRDATLHSLSFSAGTLEPAFDPEVKRYDLFLATNEREISFATELDEFATYTRSYDKIPLDTTALTVSAITKQLTIEVLADDKITINEYDVIVHRNGWELLGHAPFESRDGAGILEFDNKLWLMGGWEGGPGTSEVWVSENGVDWEFVTEAPWQGRHCAGVVAFKGRMWVISGDGIPDVWSSDDGVNWRQELDDAPWGRRYAPMVAVFNGKLWVMGGQNMYGEDIVKGIPNGTLKDVWSSADGVNWKKMRTPPWEARGIVHGYVVLDDKLWVVGGGGKVNGYGWGFSDIWNTSDGVNWELVSYASFLYGRYHFSVTVFDNKIWVTDGSLELQSDLSNEVWFSSDGKKWQQLRNVPFPATHATSLFPFKGDLFLIAGYFRNDVWRFRP